MSILPARRCAWCRKFPSKEDATRATLGARVEYGICDECVTELEARGVAVPGSVAMTVMSGPRLTAALRDVRQLARISASRRGLKTIGQQGTRVVTGNISKRFTLMEHLGDRQSATVAQVEWACMGYYCHVEVVPAARVYYIWVGPKERKLLPRTLPDEHIKRIKGSVAKLRH